MSSHTPITSRLLKKTAGEVAQDSAYSPRESQNCPVDYSPLIVAFRQSDGLEWFCCPRTAKSHSGCGGVRLCRHFHARPSRSGSRDRQRDPGAQSVGVKASVIEEALDVALDQLASDPGAAHREL